MIAPMGRALKHAGWLAAGWLGMSIAQAQTDHNIYTDSLQNSWDNWSWSSTIDPNATTVLHGGTRSMAVTITGAWGALSLHHTDLDTAPYSDLQFWVNGGSAGGQKLRLSAELAAVGQPGVDIDPLPTNAWRQVTLSLASLGIASKANFSRFSLQDRTGAASATFYLDDMKLVASGTPPPAVVLTAPLEGAVYSAPASVALAATVITNGHAINKVQFLAGTNVVAEDSLPPYATTWSNAPAGSVAVAARVVYDGAATRDSAAVNILIASNSTFAVTINAQAARHAISPLIYGTAFATTAQLSDLNFTINRSGGNSETRYNWVLNAHNHAADWYFQSIADSPATPAAASDDFVTTTKAAGADAALTIPMIEWMPKLGPNRGKLASYSIAKYGAQTGSDAQWMPDAGNGIAAANAAPILTNDPNDANFPTNSLFQQAFLQHLTNRFGLSTNGGVRHYILDNEHSIWHSTHQDVHPNGASRREIRDRMFDYSAKIKAIDPSAQVWGPEEFGWSGYLNSGADLQYGSRFGWSYLPDRSTNGSMDYVCWLLDQFHQRELSTGKRWLDYFTLHCYPEGAERNNGGADVSTSTQLLRNRSTRCFWDPSYVSESWIATPVQLIPRMKAWVAAWYPGTKLGITEYNWNAEDHINGATAQADILGIFGREGLDLATRWTTPAATSPVYKAMKIYRNYDGNKSAFGDQSVAASGTNPDQLAVFASVRSSDGALTLMAINKQLGSSGLVTFNLLNFPWAGSAQVWQLTSANTITRLADLAGTGTTLGATVPPQSVTLFVLPSSVPNQPTLRATLGSGNVLNISFSSQTNRRYQLETSTDLLGSGWVAAGQPFTGTGSASQVVNTAIGGFRQYYRLVLLPP